MTGSQVLMSDDHHSHSYTDIENVVTGSFLKIRNISGLPDEGFKCGVNGWRNWETSSLSIPSQSNVEVIDTWSELFTDSYTVINGDKKFGTFTYLFTSGSENKWKFKPTIELSVGDYLAGEDGQPLKITSFSVVSSSTQVFPISELNVEPQDYYYANGVITHNVACQGNLFVYLTNYSQYAEVFWPDSKGNTVCNYYCANSKGSFGNAPSYNSGKSGVTGCNSDAYWTSKGLCT